MIKLFTDSDCDMPRRLFERYDIGVVPFGVSYGDDVYHKDFYELTPKEFHKRCRETNAFPKTSQPTYAAYEEHLRPALQEGHDVFCLCITNKFSGSYQSGVMAMNNLREEFPDRKIVVMDSLRCTTIHGYLMYQVALMREDGMGFDELVAQTEALREEFFIFVTVDSLEFLQKGGRLGKAAALAGGILNIKPIIGFSDGELKPYSKVRGKKNAISEIIKALIKHAGDNKDDYVPMVFSCDMTEECKVLDRELQDNGYGPIIHEWEIGPVVGAHLGPTGYAAALYKKYPNQKVF